MLCILISLSSCDATSGINNNDYDASEKENNDTEENIEVESKPLYVDSVDELIETIKNVKEGKRNNTNIIFSICLLDNLKQEYKSIAVITKTDDETNKLYELVKNDINISKMNQNSEEYRRDLIILPSYIAKGLEFDAVIIYTDKNNCYKENEKYLRKYDKYKKG